MVYINDADISWSQCDADHAEAEHDSPPPPPTITPLDHVDPYPEDALDAQEAARILYEEQAALRNLYNFGY